MAYLTTTGLGACAPGQSIGPDGSCAWAGSNPGASPLLAATGRYAPAASQCEAIQSGAVTLEHGAPGMPAATQQLLSDCANSGYTMSSAPIAPAPAPAHAVASVPVFTGAAAVPQGGFVPAFSFVGDNPQAYAEHVGLRGLGDGCACGCKSDVGLCGCSPKCGKCSCNAGSRTWGPTDWLAFLTIGWIGYELFFKPAPVVLIQETAE